MFKNAKLTLAALALCSAVLPALASPLVINTGSDFNLDPNGSTKTSKFDELGYTGTLATSIYLGSPAAAGTTVIDTNLSGVMNFYGFSAGTKTTLGGNQVNFNYPANPAQLNINALNNPSAPDLNGFTAGEAFPLYGAGANTTTGLGGAWGLTYGYQIVGQTKNASGGTTGASAYVEYTTGVFSLYYQSAANDPNNGKEVLRLIVTGSQIELTNLDVFGYVDYSYAAGDSFITNFFNDGVGGGTLYSSWLTNPVSVSWTLDTNVKPPIPTADQLVAVGAPGPNGEPNGPFIRQSLLDGSLVINVPEPGSLALVGLALAGLGFSQRRRAARK